VQTGFWQKAQRKLTPSRRANSSTRGVTAAGWPRWATASARHWSGLKMTMCGRRRVIVHLRTVCTGHIFGEPVGRTSLSPRPQRCLMRLR
jgi:hypothetical protein